MVKINRISENAKVSFINNKVDKDYYQYSAGKNQLIKEITANYKVGLKCEKIFLLKMLKQSVIIFEVGNLKKTVKSLRCWGSGKFED